MKVESRPQCQHPGCDGYATIVSLTWGVRCDEHRRDRPEANDPRPARSVDRWNGSAREVSVQYGRSAAMDMVTQTIPMATDRGAPR